MNRGFRYLGIAGLLAACASPLEDLIPFPCGVDGSCPKGMSCIPDHGCDHATLSAPCTALTDCSTAGEGARCSLGICTLPCDDTRPCAAGYVCSSSGSMGEGSCVADCGGGQVCPKGLTCSALADETKYGCVGTGASGANALDRACQSNTDCAQAGSSVTCSLGACTLPCNDGQPCPEGRVCSVPAGNGVCLVDCSSGEACPANLECHDLWYGARRGCMAPDAAVPACKKVFQTNLTCDLMCGFQVNNGSECGAGACAHNSQCQSNACYCDPSTTATSCAGQPCGSAGCPSDHWWCEPKQWNLDCNTSNAGLIGGCQCVNNRGPFKRCGTTKTCDELCRAGCDPMAQDCRNPQKPKCSIRIGDEAETKCVAQTGDQQEGQSCKYDNTTSLDDCAKGLLCSASAGGVCRRICTKHQDCTAPMKCMSYGVDGWGMCLPTCDMAAPSCPAPQLCKLQGVDDNGTGFGACIVPSVFGLGYPCFGDWNCEGSLSCVRGMCDYLCSDKYPCPAPATGSVECWQHTGEAYLSYCWYKP